MVQLLRAKKLQECLCWLWRSMHLFKALQGVFGGSKVLLDSLPKACKKNPNPTKKKPQQNTTPVNQRRERTQRK